MLDMLGEIPETLGPMTAAAPAEQDLAVAFDHLRVRLPRNPPRSEPAFGSAGDYAQ